MAVLILQIISGIGAFLFAIRCIDESLIGFNLPQKIVKILDKSFLSVVFGILSAAICQSSSAVNSLTAGIRERNILGEKSALYIVAGSNIGTTVAAYIAGFDNQLFIYFCSSFLFVSSLIFMISKKNQWLLLTKFLGGFSLIFISFQIIGAALPGIVNTIDMHFLTDKQPILPFLFGLILTMLCQSSSVVSIIIIAFSKYHAITLVNALFMIMAANIGTCSTVFLVSFGKSVKSMRVAVFNLVFNLLAAGIMCIAYYTHFLQWFILLNVSIDTKIALFHTIFNFVGCIVTYSLIPKFIHFSYKKKSLFGRTEQA